MRKKVRKKPERRLKETGEPSDLTRKNVIENLVVFVGCGGIFYHGISQFSPWYHRRAKTVVLCIDHDKTEEHNQLRQWPQPNKHKASLASEALNELRIISYPLVTKIETPKDLLKIIETLREVKDYIPKNYWIIHTPDNHLCRYICHLVSGVLAQKTKQPVYELTAGNDLEGGYAYGCTWLYSKLRLENIEFGKCKNDYFVKHTDILSSAKNEQQLIEEPLSCGQADNEMSEEQSVFSNSLTASCLWSLAEDMAQGEDTKEVIWTFNNEKEHWLLRKVT